MPGNGFGKIGLAQLPQVNGVLSPQGTALSRLDVAKLRASGDEAGLRRASRDFEAILLHRMISEMRKSLPKGGLFERSMAREWFEGMLDQAVAQEMSKRSDLGIAEAVYEQMSRVAGSPGKAPGPARPGSARPSAAGPQPPAPSPPAPSVEARGADNERVSDEQGH